MLSSCAFKPLQNLETLHSLGISLAHFFFTFSKSVSKKISSQEHTSKYHSPNLYLSACGRSLSHNFTALPGANHFHLDFFLNLYWVGLFRFFVLNILRSVLVAHIFGSLVIIGTIRRPTRIMLPYSNVCFWMYYFWMAVTKDLGRDKGEGFTVA